MMPQAGSGWHGASVQCSITINIPGDKTMIYGLAADLLVLLHFGFILLVLLGGFWAVRHRWFACIHLPAVAWAAALEFAGWVCPLTPWEQQLRRLAGHAAYTGGFIEHYLTSLIYPSGLTSDIQLILGTLVILLNLGVYTYVLRRWSRR